MGINSHLSTCVGTQSPKYLEMAQRHISLSVGPAARPRRGSRWLPPLRDGRPPRREEATGASSFAQPTAAVCGSATRAPMVKVAASGSTATPLCGGASVDDHLSAYCYFFSRPTATSSPAWV
ncbi:uncharacterized protein LOC100274989 [Zea mays]|uniref:Uncharacterized protein n=1 Tax=Zea mays TaxID=4577 RepID=B6SM57_MAIZE|nr:uncharacterized protein LOC100274989 [Zea mays]ACG25940.1 hypothetical protein [Zea mays]|eukprot:NP_001142688.1 uncharacterized protein LOC100274989 [Zea mays]